MIINHNISALNAWRSLNQTNSALAKSLEKLSSGMRINRAADDAAGLAISEKMRGQINGLNQAVRNAQDGISLIQTAEGALNETHSILQRMRQLAVQAANDTSTNDDRQKIQDEMNQLAAELSRISNTTEFNTKNLLAGGFTSQLFHIGANQNQNIQLNINPMDAYSLGVTADYGQVTGVGSNSAGITVQVIGKGLSGTYKVNLKAATAATTSTTANYDSTSATLTVTLAATSTGGVTATLNDVINAINNANGLSGKSFSFLATLEGGVIGTNKASAENVTISAFTTSKNAGVTINGVVTSDAVAAKGILVLRQDAANNAITVINNAINTVSIERSKLGAVQNRLEHTIANLGVSSENLSAAESRIRDVDMAQEMMNFTRNQILQQAGTAMLAQANMAPQAVLKLLG
ncbi:flagellin [Desulfofundulus thermobenzoicus]|uniref:Flagellin n=1 Tax=Desulfofundulus thermobenzoicus TaxID=29376 RepID=A0A6N7INB4_9FIRM|nr:flagellin [Desulfofundulus thermobenzoicus]